MPSLLDQIETVQVSALKPHPDNPRKGDVKLIGESLTENQQFAPIVVQRSTGYVLSGNHTLAASVQLGWQEIDVVYVDVDDDRALKILLAANRTADVASYDNEALQTLLEMLNGDFAGTGYSEDDLNSLIAAVDEVPDLDDLADELGEHRDEDLWPTLRFKVSPHARTAFYDLTEDAPDHSDDARFAFLLSKAGWDRL